MSVKAMWELPLCQLLSQHPLEIKSLTGLFKKWGTCRLGSHCRLKQLPSPSLSSRPHYLHSHWMLTAGSERWSSDRCQTSFTTWAPHSNKSPRGETGRRTNRYEGKEKLNLRRRRIRVLQRDVWLQLKNQHEIFSPETSWSLLTNQVK